MYTGWLLPEKERAKLLQKFPPHYHDVIAHHITLRMGEGDLPLETSAKIVGTMDDGQGCQVMAVSINGSTKRPDGKMFHITLSIDRDNHNRKPVDSNNVLEEFGWLELYQPINIEIIPHLFE